VFQPRGLVVERIDDRCEQKTRPVVVELDEPAAALGRKMKIPGTEEADFRPSQLRNRRRLAQGRRLPRHAAGDAIEGADEIGNLGENGGGNDLMLGHDREFTPYVRHAGGLERGVEGVGAARI
jgi:hypothetical protein